MIRSIPNTADIDNPGDPAQPPASLPGLLLPQGSDIVYSTQAPSDSNKQNTKISSKEWASVKNKIRHLYVEERLSIDKLMQTMKEKYSFKATYGDYASLCPGPGIVAAIGLIHELASTNYCHGGR